MKKSQIAGLAIFQNVLILYKCSGVFREPHHQLTVQLLLDTNLWLFQNSSFRNYANLMFKKARDPYCIQKKSVQQLTTEKRYISPCRFTVYSSTAVITVDFQCFPNNLGLQDLELDSPIALIRMALEDNLQELEGMSAPVSGGQ